MLNKRATTLSTLQRWFHTKPLWMRAATVYCLTLLLLLLIEQFTFIAMQIPFTISTSASSLRIGIDGSNLGVALPASPTKILFVRTDSALREFQLDGTDSINNFSLNTSYIHQIENSPYYRFQAWMRDIDSYSSWRDIRIRVASSGRLLASVPVAETSTLLPLPEANATVSASIERLEVPVEIDVFCGDNECGTIEVDRNDRFVQVQSLLADGSPGATQKVFFPHDPLPFVAEVAYLLIQTMIWSTLLLGLLVLLHAALLVVPAKLAETGQATATRVKWQPSARASSNGGAVSWWRTRSLQLLRWPHGTVRRLTGTMRRYGDGWDLVAAALTLAAGGFTVWIALVEYHAEPHILDASAYIFQAKIFASGQLSAPVPANLGAFQGPFMVAYQGRWFAQYAPGTSAILALGMLLHIPWLVEPVLGSFALFGIYKLGRLMFSPLEALLALLLGALSAFYLFLAASYLSHTIALFFGVYFLLALLHFDKRPRQLTFVIAALCAGGLLLTRELSAVLVCGGSTLVLISLHWRSWWRQRDQIVSLAVIPVGILVFFGFVYLAYNALQTGNPFLLPRTIFNPADRYGFGQGIGFYGQHTLAAGFVNLDQLLTILLIDLYGWPFYFTLALVPLAFLRRLRSLEWDVFCLAVGSLLILAMVGYFYHGIYLGPRYLYDALPFLLLLTARGLTALFGVLVALTGRLAPTIQRARLRGHARNLVLMLAVVLIGCNVLYYLPRQIAIYRDYTGLPITEPLQVTTIYSFHPAQAIVVTSDWYVYNYVLFPLNDPSLAGETLYAYAAGPATLTQLEEQYPSRKLYWLQVGPNGVVTFAEVAR
ncbi:MAG: hypothetical protein ACLQUY_16610 [Ktedonobacterales bacterium]